jgi:hypothetical protein
MHKTIVLTLLIAAALSGCATGSSVIFEAYSEKPISTKCAIEVITQSTDYTDVKADQYSVSFGKGMVFGALVHGGEEHFTRYGVELNTVPFMGPDLVLESNSLIELLKSKCSK